MNNAVGKQEQNNEMYMLRLHPTIDTQYLAYLQADARSSDPPPLSLRGKGRKAWRRSWTRKGKTAMAM